MTRSLVTILIVILACLSGFASEDGVFSFKADTKDRAFRQVISRLKTDSRIKMSFVQDKKIKSLSRPLRSEGVFLVQNKSVCWKTEKPFKSSLLISKEGIKKKVGDNPITFDSAADKVEIRTFVKIMLSLFNADDKALMRDFDLYFLNRQESWTIGLKPRRRILGKILKSITISGTWRA